MSVYPVFPTLAGQGWSIHKKPTFSSVVTSHVSGREVRAALYQNPVWQFELTFDALDGSSLTYPGLGANSLQALMGLFLQCQGQFAPFLYNDPTDNAAASSAVGIGDGSTSAFTLSRTLGGFTEPCGWVNSVAPFIDGVAQPSGWTLTPPNTLTFATPPLGPPGGAQFLQETAVTGQHNAYANLTSQAAGTLVTASVYVQAAGRSQVELQIYNGSAYPGALFDLNALTATPSGAVSAYSIVSVGGGWFSVSITATMAAAATPIVKILAANAGVISYLGVVGNGLLFCGARVSFGGAAPAYLAALASVTNAALSTSAAPVPAGPLIAANISYAFLCRFDGDDLNFEQFMANLWKADSVKFRSLRAQ